MATNDQPRHFLGIDLGGTKILVGVFDRDLQLIAKDKKRTRPELGADGVIGRIADCVDDAIKKSGIERSSIIGAATGAPGSVDTESGNVLFSGNLAWKNVPLASELSKRIGVPVTADNDCNIATLGVHEIELESKPESLAGIFIGTGIGGGLILNRKLYTGPTHTAFEIGHMIIDFHGPKCTSGIRGTWEAFAGKHAIARRLADAVKKGRKSKLTDIVDGDLRQLGSRDLRKALKKGDALVEEVVKETAEIIGIGLANLINILNVQTLVLGGGVIEAVGEAMMPTILTSTEKNAFPGSFKGVEIAVSELGDHAGIHGAAVLARNTFDR